jgi:hypothetical protein
VRHYNGRKLRTQGVGSEFPVHEWMESGHRDPWRGTPAWRSVTERERPANEVWFGRPILVGEPQFHSVSVMPASEDDS